LDWRIPYPSIRQPILAANCVATSQPLAAQAGLAMLARGGNVVDAAFATAVALTVVEPVTNGIGSDAFAIVASGGALVGLNASGRSPAGWTEARFADQRSMPATGWDSVTVPGAVSAWVALHKRFGRLPFATLFEPAIGYARRGFLVSPVVAEMWSRQAATLAGYREFARVFLPQGRAPPRLANSSVAWTMPRLWRRSPPAKGAPSTAAPLPRRLPWRRGRRRRNDARRPR
jgi:gamma-glutamyltranspeptidase / glutathione hydrolase